MTVKAGRGHPKRQEYKVTVALFPHEWDELRMEAATRKITGGELIASLLSQYIHRSSSPLPDDDGTPDPEDA